MNCLQLLTWGEGGVENGQKHAYVPAAIAQLVKRVGPEEFLSHSNHCRF